MSIKLNQEWGEDVEKGRVMGNFKTLFPPINLEEGKKPLRYEPNYRKRKNVLLDPT